LNPPPGGSTIRRLEEADAAELERFPCRTFREPWTDELEAVIREQLPYAVEHDRSIVAYGAFDGDELCAVAAVRYVDVEDERVCRSLVLATRFGQRRRGMAAALKRFVIDDARKAGATSMISHVAWDNEAMLRLNARLGGSTRRIEGDPDFALCVIPLR
jgi:predicted GNAT superfamily acetyltransferase